MRSYLFQDLSVLDPSVSHSEFQQCSPQFDCRWANARIIFCALEPQANKRRLLQQFSVFNLISVINILPHAEILLLQ
jgi:hypothetical protein